MISLIAIIPKLCNWSTKTLLADCAINICNSLKALVITLIAIESIMLSISCLFDIDIAFVQST